VVLVGLRGEAGLVYGFRTACRPERFAGEHASRCELEPCAPGARPRIRMRLAGSPNEGTGLSPVVPVAKGAPLHGGDALAVLPATGGNGGSLQLRFAGIWRVRTRVLFDGRIVFGCSGRCCPDSALACFNRCGEPRVVMKKLFLVAFVFCLGAATNANAAIKKHPRKRRHPAVAATHRAPSNPAPQAATATGRPAPIVRVATQSPRRAPAPAPAPPPPAPGRS